MEVENFTTVAATSMENFGVGGGAASETYVSGAVPNLTQVNQQNSVTMQNLTQNLHVAYASNDPQIIAEAWQAIDQARAETASVSAQASHVVGTLQSQLEAASQENQRIREEAARQAAIAENQAVQLKQEAHRALAASQEALRNANDARDAHHIRADRAQKEAAQL